MSRDERQVSQARAGLRGRMSRLEKFVYEYNRLHLTLAIIESHARSPATPRTRIERVFDAVVGDPGIQAPAIAKATGITMATLYKLMGDMVRRGLVHKVGRRWYVGVSPDDGRVRTDVLPIGVHSRGHHGQM